MKYTLSQGASRARLNRIHVNFDLSYLLSNYNVKHVPKLSDDDRLLIDCPIKLQEIGKAIDSLSSNKSPGPDGINAEFYKHFKSTLSPILQRVFSHAFVVGKIPLSFTRAHTVLIPKTEEVVKLRKVTGYRPITLCKADYKVFAKILSNRLQSVIGDIVGNHQTCGIRGRTN